MQMKVLEIVVGFGASERVKTPIYQWFSACACLDGFATVSRIRLRFPEPTFMPAPAGC
jgi:hypothetical protein